MSDKKQRIVVSANYLDRNDKNFRWLFRSEEEGLGAVRPVRSLYASGVTFESSTELEEGFGCETVAYCESMILDESYPTGLQFKSLYFKGFAFHTLTQDGQIDDLVYSCDHLMLNEDGSMLFAMNSPIQKPAGEVATTARLH